MVDTAPVHSTKHAKADATGDPAAGTPVGGTDTDVRIDVDLLGEHLLGRWAEDRRISRRLALDPRCTRSRACLRRRPRPDARPAPDPRRRGCDPAPLPRGVRRLEQPRREPRSVRGAHDGGSLDADQGRCAVGAVRLRGPPPRDRAEPPRVPARHRLVRGARVLRDDRDRTRVGRPEHRHARHVRPGHTEEFEIHTPFRGAWKDYIGNAALHGKAAVVFAKLVTKGVDHGVHAFSTCRSVTPTARSCPASAARTTATRAA